MLKIKKDFFHALLIYLTSVAQMPQVVFYFIIMLIGIYYSLNNFKTFKFEKSDTILIVFIVGTIISFLIGKFFGNTDYIFKDYERSKDFFPFTVILFGTIFFSKNMSLEKMKYLLYLILFEASIAIAEYSIGIQYIIYPGDLGSETKFGETDLLYYNRVFGLSPNVSVLGLKLVVGIVFSIFLLEKNSISKQQNYYFVILLIIASILSFQRTAILTSFIFLSFYILPQLFKMKFKYKVVLLALISLFFLLIFVNLEQIIFQFTRGRSGGFTDIRAIIFGLYVDFISENMLWGNFSEKIYMSFSGHSYHAHNSYLQLIATIGIPLFLIWLIYFCQIIRSSRFVFIIPFLVYSLSQYGIFWGCSLFDVAMYSLIFQSKVDLKEVPEKSLDLKVAI